VALYIRDPALRGVVSLLCQLDNSVAMIHRDVCVVSCYVSPSTDLRGFNAFLNELEGIVLRHGGRKIILGGDFNSYSRLWGSQITNRRGEKVESWAACLDLTLHNDGVTYTCVRPQGSSIVDLTWSSSDLAGLVSNWHVSPSETLSDHSYLVYELRGCSSLVRVGANGLPR